MIFGAYVLVCTKKNEEETDSIFNKEDKQTRKRKKQWMMLKDSDCVFFVYTVFSRHIISNSYKTIRKKKQARKTHPSSQTVHIMIFKEKSKIAQEEQEKNEEIINYCCCCC